MPMQFKTNLRPFNRRKSSGNALDDVSSPAAPSFRVLERPHESGKSFDGHAVLSRTSEVRPLSEGTYNEGDRAGMNRGSGGTHNSASSGVYNSSSSAHYSSTSTLPSDASHDDGNFKPKGLPHTQTAPSGFSLRAAGRAFSFGGRKAPQPQLPINPPPVPQHSVPYADIPDIQLGSRQRAMTETSYASESTATPPKFLDSDFNFGRNGSTDDFSTMFSNFDDKRGSRTLVASPPAESPTGGYFETGKRLPAPIRVSGSQPVSPAPFSNESQNSKDGLLSSEYGGVTGMRRKPSPQLNAPPSAVLRSTPSPNSQERHGARATTGFRERPTGLADPARTHQRERSDPSFLDEDTRLAMQFMGHAQRPTPPTHKSSPPVPRKAIGGQMRAPGAAHDTSAQRRTYTFEDGSNQDFALDSSPDNNSIMTTPRANRATLAPMEHDLHHSSSLQEMASYGDRLEERSKGKQPMPRKPVSGGKVMTPAQFERYKKEQESRQLNDDSESESDKASEPEEEEDEEERNREMARQRRKQEADLAVYRQKMMKLTGEPATLRPASQSVPNLTVPQIHSPQENSVSGDRSSEDDEDDEVPLAVLAAHGFPSKNRPPSQLNRQSSQPTIHYQSETYPPPPPSMSGQSTRGGGKNLPPFARNLPKDPYFGAGLVAPSDRQSLAFGAGSRSVYGGSSAGGPPPGAHPGGLVGVIAKEEQARAMRRGSPNAAASGGGFDASNHATGLSQSPGGLPGMPPPMTPDQAAQMQMTHQMTQMMQMQMQWMQQMMAVQGMNGSGGVPPMPPMPGMPGMAGMAGMPGMPGMPPMPPMPGMQAPRPGSAQAASGARPQSSGRSMTMGARTSTAGLQGHPRMLATRSSTALGLGPQQGGAGYAPSLAPSERSNVGQPSRYRPVSTMPADGDALETGSMRSGYGGGRASVMGARSSTIDFATQRASTMGAGALNAWDAGRRDSQAPAASGRVSFGGAGAFQKGKAKLQAALRSKTADEEDDDAGWAEMRRKRESKKGAWKDRRADSRLGRDGEGLEGLEGVYYPTD